MGGVWDKNDPRWSGRNGRRRADPGGRPEPHVDAGAPDGQIVGSRVAHAEINALVQLGTDRRYFDCTLWTTFEPCAQCVSAAWLSTIGRVCFAASDVYAGASKLIERQIEAADSARRFPMRVEGPEEGSFGLLAELLPVFHFLDTDPDHRVTKIYRERRPEIVALAERLQLRKHTSASLTDIEAIVTETLRDNLGKDSN